MQHSALVLGMRLPAVDLERSLGSCISHCKVLVECCRHQEEVICSTFICLFVCLSGAAKKRCLPKVASA